MWAMSAAWGISCSSSVSTALASGVHSHRCSQAPSAHPSSRCPAAMHQVILCSPLRGAPQTAGRQGILQ